MSGPELLALITGIAGGVVLIIMIVIGTLISIGIIVAAYIFTSQTLQNIGNKARVKDGWRAYVPVAKSIYQLEIVNRPWYHVFMFSPTVVVFISGLIILLFAVAISGAGIVIATLLVVIYFCVYLYERLWYLVKLYERFKISPFVVLGCITTGGIVTLIFNCLIAYTDVFTKEGPEPPPRPKEGHLRCDAGVYKGAVFPIQANEVITIGRDSAKAQIVIDSSGQDISREHCQISFDPRNGGEYTVTDVSVNGVFFANDNSKLMKNMPVKIERGTTIYLVNRNNMFTFQ